MSKQTKAKVHPQKIKLTLTRSDGTTSNAALTGDLVTPVMLEAAEDLLYALCNNAKRGG